MARVEGRLTVDDDGCVFSASPEQDGAIALAWPPDYEARVGANDVVEIVDGDGGVVLREGDYFAAAGGLGPTTYETRHSLDVHGRQTFFIGMPVERLRR